MRIIRDLSKTYNFDNLSIALGNFDGIHIGHKKIITETVNMAKQSHGCAALFTFYPHPLKVLKGSKEPFIIQTFKKKMQIVSQMGIDMVVCAKFSKNFADMHPEAFVKDILVNSLKINNVFVGYDYTFGKYGKGTVNSLRDYAKKYGFNVHVIPAVKIDGIVVSSSKIREFFRSGEIKLANLFLGRNYTITGVVRRGDERGRALGFPTANIYPHNEILLKNGVYAAYVYINDKKYKSAVNIGSNPTFSGVDVHIEAFIFGFNRDIYGEKITIEFVDFLREEIKFKNISNLVERIKLDIKESKKLL